MKKSWLLKSVVMAKSSLMLLLVGIILLLWTGSKVLEME